MSLIRKSLEPKLPKKFIIAGKEYYTIKGAAERLIMSESAVCKGLRSRSLPLRFSKMDDNPKSRIYVSVEDVEVLKQTRERDFEIRLKISEYLRFPSRRQ